MSEKVVDLNAKRDEKLSEQAYGLDLPPEILEKVKAVKIKVDEVEKLLSDTLETYANQNTGENKLDISIPLEGTVQTFAILATYLDHQMQPNQREAHVNLRAGLMSQIDDAIQAFLESSPESVYTQDIYVALALSAIGWINSYRINTYLTKHQVASAQEDKSHE